MLRGALAMAARAELMQVVTEAIEPGFDVLVHSVR
jgi:hypothetical protein